MAEMVKDAREGDSSERRKKVRGKRNEKVKEKNEK